MYLWIIHRYVKATMTQDTLTFETERGANIAVTAENGTVLVSVDSPAITLNETSAFVETHKGLDVLNCGKHRVQGNREIIQIPVGEHKEQIEQLREDSVPTITDEPLMYEVEEYSKGTGSWGQELTGARLTATKEYAEMTDRQKELHMKVNTDRAPKDSEDGDVYSVEDLLGDTRTREEKEQDALDEARETGENVIITKATTGCNDSSKECNLDHVTKVATPGGEIETRRVHTY